MIDVLHFDRAHLAAFVPGCMEAPWLDQLGRDRIGEMMAIGPTVTLVAGDVVVGFTGSHKREDGRLYLWSMWSDFARKHPIVLARALRRMLPVWREISGQELIALDEGHALQRKFARWLGMTERSPGVWVA